MTEAAPVQQSYQQRVWSELRRNRPALLGGIVVFIVATIAVLCPLLANNRPLYIEAAFPSDYQNAIGIAMETASAAARPPAAEKEEAIEAFRDSIVALEDHLSGEWLDRLQEAEQQILSDSSADAGAIFDPFWDAQLEPQARFPAFRTLTRAEIFVLISYFATGLYWITGRRFLRPLLAIPPILLLAFLAAVILRFIYPPLQDARNYFDIVRAPEFSQSGSVLFAPVPYGENQAILRDAREAPSWFLPPEERPPLRFWHWLGTDTNGRDVLSRMVYGARVSMLIGIFAVSIYTFIGVVLGAIAGYFRGWTDIALSRIIEIVICFPALMVILAVQAFLAPSLVNIILALALLMWPAVARLERGEFLRLANSDFVEGVRALGGSNTRIIFLHILPNALGPILVLASFGIAGSILVESGLSFLGFGVPQPMASWGDLLNNGRNDIRGTWWLTVFPGLAIFLTVTCFNLIGDGVRDALDPRKR